MNPLDDNARQTAQELGRLAAELSKQRPGTKPLPIPNQLSALLARLPRRSPASQNARHDLLTAEFMAPSS